MLDSIRDRAGRLERSAADAVPPYLGNLLHGDFGVSYSQYPTRVSDIIGNYAALDAVLAGSATLLPS